VHAADVASRKCTSPLPDDDERPSGVRPRARRVRALAGARERPGVRNSGLAVASVMVPVWSEQRVKRRRTSTGAAHAARCTDEAVHPAIPMPKQAADVVGIRQQRDQQQDSLRAWEYIERLHVTTQQKNNGEPESRMLTHLVGSLWRVRLNERSCVRSLPGLE